MCTYTCKYNCTSICLSTHVIHLQCVCVSTRVKCVNTCVLRSEFKYYKCVDKIGTCTIYIEQLLLISNSDSHIAVLFKEFSYTPQGQLL